MSNKYDQGTNFDRKAYQANIDNGYSQAWAMQLARGDVPYMARVNNEGDFIYAVPSSGNYVMASRDGDLMIRYKPITGDERWTIRQVEDHLGTSHQTIRYRLLKNEWSLDKALGSRSKKAVEEDELWEDGYKLTPLGSRTQYLVLGHSCGTIEEWADRTGIPAKDIRGRIRQNWIVAEALTVRRGGSRLTDRDHETFVQLYPWNKNAKRDFPAAAKEIAKKMKTTN